MISNGFAPSKKNRLPSSILGLGLAGLCLVLYSQVLGHGFVNYDDDKYVTGNIPVRQGLTREGVRWAFTAGLSEETQRYHVWGPVTVLSRMLDIELFGMNPAGPHAVNLLLHVLNTLLLFFLLKGMTGSLWKSAFVAAFFAWHPFQVETVAWVSARRDLLAVFFGFLAMHFYVRSVKDSSPWPILWLNVFFAFSLMSKPVLLFLPLLLILIDLWPLERFKIRSALENKGVLFLIAAVVGGTALFAQRDVLQPAAVAERVIRAVVMQGVYLGKTFFPHGFGLYARVPDVVFPLWLVAGSGLFLLCFTVYALRTIRENPPLAVGWGWFLGMLLPVVHLRFPADRYMYFPIIGLFLLAVWGIAPFIEKHAPRRMVAAAGGLFLCVLLPVSFLQVRHWKDSSSLFERALHLNPENYLAHNNLGAVLYAEGKIDEAMAHYAEAVRIEPEYAEAYYNLGNLLIDQGRYAEAIRHFSDTLRLNPEDLWIHHHLGLAWAQKGGVEEAIHHFQEALKFRTPSERTHYNLAVLFTHQGKYEEAIRHCTEALRIRPRYVEANRLKSAIKRLHFHKASQKKYLDSHPGKA